MEKVVITQFSDPMMGLSWECEPAIREVEQRFGDQVEICDVMRVLMRDVTDFMTPQERSLPEAEGVARYNERLAQIYREEEALGGMPINMDGFCLFAPGRRSSMQLCLAYEAAELAEPEKAREFLYRLREATVAKCRPTTKREELLQVVRDCGIDEEQFTRCFDGPAAQDALWSDLRYGDSFGIFQLPAFVVSKGDKALMFTGVPTATMLARAVESVSS